MKYIDSEQETERQKEMDDSEREAGSAWLIDTRNKKREQATHRPIPHRPSRCYTEDLTPLQVNAPHGR